MDREETDAEKAARESTEGSYKRAPIDWPASEERGPPPPRKWAIENWLGLDYVTLLSGLGGIGKSVLTQQMATALVIGHEFIATVPQQRVVLVWAGEDDEDELIRRQIVLCEHFGVRRMDLKDRLVIQPLRDVECSLLDIFSGKPMRTSMLKELREQIGDYKATVAMLDNIGRLFGGNENDRHHVTSFMSALAWAGAATHAAMLLIGHTAKLTGSEYSGSTAWENAARARLYFSDKSPDKAEDEKADSATSDMRFLTKRKVNYTAKDLCTMVWDRGVYNIITAPLQGGMVDAINRVQARNVIMAGITKLMTMGIIPTDSQSSPNYLPRLIMDHKLNEGASKGALTQAMRLLMVEGVLKRVQVGAYGNRTPRYGLVVI